MYIGSSQIIYYQKMTFYFYLNYVLKIFSLVKLF